MEKGTQRDHSRDPIQKTKMGGNPPRLPLVDFLRSLAILLMVIYHGHYDLNHFGLISIDLQRNPFWWTLPRVIVFLFLFCVGVGISLTHRQGIVWSKALRRLMQIGFFAVIISLVTYVLFPGNWVYFGTLHCIAISGFLVLPLAGRPRLALTMAVLILAFNALLLFSDSLPESLALLGRTFPQINRPSMDYIPLYPWISVVLLGLGLGPSSWIAVPWPRGKFHTFCLWPSQHSLLIYLLHQPLLFAMCYALSRLLL